MRGGQEQTQCELLLTPLMWHPRVWAGMAGTDWPCRGLTLSLRLGLHWGRV